MIDGVEAAYWFICLRSGPGLHVVVDQVVTVNPGAGCG
jgi:hypothetical protein